MMRMIRMTITGQPESPWHHRTLAKQTLWRSMPLGRGKKNSSPAMNYISVISKPDVMILHCAKSTWGSQQRNHPNSQCEDRQHFSSSRGDFYVSRMLFHWKNLWKCEFLSFKKGTSSMFKPIPDLTISWICLFRSQNHPHKLEILAR